MRWGLVERDCPPRPPAVYIPDGLAWVIGRALEKDSSKRFPDAASMQQALLPFARGAS